MAASIAATAAACLVGVAVAAPSAHPRPARPAEGNVTSAASVQVISVTTTTCAPRWHAPNAGRRTFGISDSSAYGLTMYLFHPVSNTIVSKIAVRAHHVRDLTVRLTAGGHYMWGCDLAGRPPRVSDVETVPLDPDHGGPGPPVVPVTRDELIPAMKAYRTWVSAELSELAGQVSTLATDLHSGNTAAAMTQWVTAHQTWLRIGQDDGAYGVFGQQALAIDGTSAGLVRGTADRKFQGFHRIEYDLWTKHDDPAAYADTAALSAALSTLTATSVASWLPLSTAGVSGLPLRSHEVLEDAERDTLSGNDDYGSGTGLASVLADVSATREFLDLLEPLITARSAHLVSRARRALGRLVTVVEATRTSGDWVGVAELPQAQREQVDAALGAALEILAPIPDLLTIGRS